MKNAALKITEILVPDNITEGYEVTLNAIAKLAKGIATYAVDDELFDNSPCLMIKKNYLWRSLYHFFCSLNLLIKYSFVRIKVGKLAIQVDSSIW